MSALGVNTTGQQNTALGYDAFGALTTGSYGVAIGYQAGKSLTTAHTNTAVGRMSLYTSTTGANNTCLGEASGYAITTGSNNVCIGAESGSPITTQSSQLYIARDNVGSSNAAVWIYGNSIGNCYQGSNNSAWSTTSDGRLKKNIVDNNVGLDIVDKVKVRNFKYKQYNEGSPVTSDDTVNLSEFAGVSNIKHILIGQGKTETQLGVVAQELETVAPNCVETDHNGVKSVQTDELFWHIAKMQ